VLGNSQQEWSLQRCVQHAYEHNITIQNAALQVNNQQIALTAARHSRYPNLNANTGAALNFGRTVDPTTNDFVQQSFLSNNVGLSTNVTLYNGGSISNSIKRAELLQAATLLDLDQSKTDIALQIANAYLNVLFAEENLAISRQQLILSQEQLSQTTKLVDAGARPENEVLDIEAQIALNEQSLVDRENAVMITSLNLKQLLRLEPDVEMTLVTPDKINITLDPDAVTFKELYQQAVQTQAFVSAGEKRVQAARINEKIAKASMMPSLGAGANLQSNFIDAGKRVVDTRQVTVNQELQINDVPVTVGFPQDIPVLEDNPYFNQMDENLSYGFGVQLSVPIYNRYTGRAQVEQAQVSTMLQDNQLTQLKDNLKITVQQSLADARAAKRRYEATQKSLSAAMLAFDNATVRYDLGAINPIEYVTSKNQLENAQINEVIAKYQYLFATKTLDFYLGNPLTLN
jgi:outer membrane protein